MLTELQNDELIFHDEDGTRKWDSNKDPAVLEIVAAQAVMAECGEDFVYEMLFEPDEICLVVHSNLRGRRPSPFSVLCMKLFFRGGIIEYSISKESPEDGDIVQVFYEIALSDPDAIGKMVTEIREEEKRIAELILKWAKHPNRETD